MHAILRQRRQSGGPGLPDAAGPQVTKLILKWNAMKLVDVMR